MLWAVLRANDQGIGTFAAKRRETLDLRDPAVCDAVSTYDITINGDRIGTVKHRYGDGAWTLVRLGVELWESKR